MSDQSIPAETGVLVPHTFVTLTAVLAGWTHGLHGPLAGLLVALGIAADLNRCPWSRKVRIGPLTLPVRSYVPPLRIGLATAVVSVFLSVVWWKLPNACWPSSTVSSTGSSASRPCGSTDSRIFARFPTASRSR